MNQADKKRYIAIDEILWKDWDPIGVNDNENLRDEYQSYTPHVFKLKKEGADLHKIARHLYQLETVGMGMSGNLMRCEVIAEKIIELK
ncbi:hypothetical protein [Bacteroides sp. 519]|uniref:hypothetical protein n=1 Tax=Bacteroides sp. 519 TaxID=2302937 RepID=UPI0013D5133C|nr:hypothetical protein [Bacteroides sp. 519]NDV56883.1 hypothetical protein [Bacteroides sp. 519]